MKIDSASVFGTIEGEVERKLIDSLEGPARAEAELGRLCAGRFGDAAFAEVQRALRFVRSLPSKDPTHPSLEVYLSHPIRVACFVTRLQCEPQVEALLTALLHNVYEVTGLQESALVANGFNERLARGIRLLTIDRRRETDPGYLLKFYSEIELFGENLSLIRCVDKWDNILELELLEDDRVRTSYLDLAHQFVAPMARRLSPDFGRYFEETIACIRPRPFRADLRRRYDELIDSRRKESMHT
jgi:(p)ppGpp synthase/HD superfamily hydrolase